PGRVPTRSAGVATRAMPGETAPIVVDMLNTYEHEDAAALRRSVRERLPAMRRLIDAAREADVLTVYVNDNYGDWTATGATLAEHLADAALELMETNRRARLVAADASAFERD